MVAVKEGGEDAAGTFICQRSVGIPKPRGGAASYGHFAFLPTKYCVGGDQLTPVPPGMIAQAQLKIVGRRSRNPIAREGQTDCEPISNDQRT